MLELRPDDLFESRPIDFVQEVHRLSRPRFRPRNVGARCWIRSIQKQTGLSLGELDRRFPSRKQARTGSRADSSRRFHGAARGARFPLRAKTVVNGREILLTDAVEEIAPGTTKKLLSPLWDALDYATPIAAWRLERYLAALPSEVFGRIFFVDLSKPAWKVDFYLNMYGDDWQYLRKLDETMDSFAAVALVARSESQMRSCLLPHEPSPRLSHWDWIGMFGLLRCMAARFAAAEHLPKEDASALIWAAEELFPAPSEIYRAEYEDWVNDVKARRRVGALFGFVEAARSP